VQPTIGGFDVVFNSDANGSLCGEPDAQGPVLPYTCNLTGSWTDIENTHGAPGKRSAVSILPGAHPNTYVVMSGSTLRAHLNVTMPTMSARQGLVSGDWTVKTGGVNRITAKISTYQARSATTVPPCTELAWTNNAVHVKTAYVNLPPKPNAPARVTALGVDLVNVSVDINSGESSAFACLEFSIRIEPCWNLEGCRISCGPMFRKTRLTWI
jgi:hypothetical protein